jgi:hypothetical protein
MSDVLSFGAEQKKKTAMLGQGLISESKDINWIPMISESCVAGFPSEIVDFPPKSTKKLSVPSQ